MSFRRDCHEGIAAGTFRQDLNLRLMRDIVYGTFDLEAIGCLAAKADGRGRRRPGCDPVDPASHDRPAGRGSPAAQAGADPGFARAKVAEIARLAGVVEGQAAGDFRNVIVPRVLRNMFLGAFSHMALRWLVVQEDFHTDKMKEIEEMIDLFSTAVKAVPDGGLLS